VEREQAIEQLPEVHAEALRLRSRGLDDEALARALSLPAEAVPVLLRLAEEKLTAALLDAERGKA
jgi:DNA-directed RNA polymerase specialized sigma24 family protein